MINFNLQGILTALVLLRQQVAHAAAKAAESPGANMTPADLERFRQNFEGIAEPLRRLYIAEGRVGRISTIARLNGPYVAVMHELTALDSDIMDAAQFERFFHYRADKGLAVLTWEGTWGPVLNAFPSTRKDVFAAVDCYAMEHPDASIYHSMMVLERGMPALAKKLGVRFSKARPTWSNMADDIRDRIADRRTAIGRTPPGRAPLSKAAATKERKLLDAAGEAALEFRFFEHAWRNHIAHGRAAYDENDAKKVLDHTKSYMEAIATKLKLREGP